MKPAQGPAMTAEQRARRLSRALRANFRIDLFSVVVERDFERHLAEAIAAAEQEAFRRGRETARTLAGSRRDESVSPDDCAWSGPKQDARAGASGTRAS